MARNSTSPLVAVSSRRALALLAGGGVLVLLVLWACEALSGRAALLALAGFGFFAAIAAVMPRPAPPGRPADARAAGPEQPRPGLPSAVMEALPDPFLLLDSRGRILEANAAARRLLGERIAGKALATVLRSPALLDAWNALQAGREVGKIEFTLPVPVERHLQAVLKSLAAEPGAARSAAALLVLTDVTPMKRLERMRADFVANVSHELRTPLSVLSGFIETLRGPARDDPEARERFLDIMADQGRRMARLIEDLLSLARIEMNEHLRPTERVDLNDLLRGVAAALEPLAQASGAVLRVDLSESLPPVSGDRDQLYQVFQNLLDNAIKYGASGGVVTIEPGTPGAPGHVAVTVRDRGEGISPEHIPRLTERFYRVDNARSRERGGTGLGLAIVKHVLNRHGGRLAIGSAPGQGSAFTVSLPVAAPAAQVSQNRHATVTEASRDGATA